MNFDYSIMGKRIAMRRNELGLSQLEFAEKINISNNHLSSIERGKQKPSFETFLLICQHLETTPNYLINGILSPGDIPKQIIDNLRLCNSKDVELIREMSEILIKRNSS